MKAGLCGCGHRREAHEHFRPGRDCGICGVEVCARFRPRSGLGALVARLRAPVRHQPASRLPRRPPGRSEPPMAEGGAPAA